MYEHTKLLILILSFVGAYKLSDYENLSKFNSSSNFSDLDVSIDPLVFDDGHTMYEALKNIQNSVYPKLYKAIGPIGHHIKSNRNITMDDIESENLYTKLDQNVIESKHANIDGGSAESNLLPMGNNNNLPSALQLIDPLFLMAVLGFIAYIVNTVLGLVDKLHLTNVLGVSAPPFYSNHRRQQDLTIPSFDVNQNFLRDLERIFRLAIEMYERKI